MCLKTDLLPKMQKAVAASPPFGGTFENKTLGHEQSHDISKCKVHSAILLLVNAHFIIVRVAYRCLTNRDLGTLGVNVCSASSCSLCSNTPNKKGALFMIILP